MLNMKDGDTVQSLLQIAKRVEQIDETEQKVEKAVRRVEGLEDAQTNQEITALSQQLSAVQAQVNRISGRRKGPNELGAVPKDRRICWTCGGDDHLRRNCPYNRRGRPSRGRGELICWTCGNPGHRRADCAMNQKPPWVFTPLIDVTVTGSLTERILVTSEVCSAACSSIPLSPIAPTPHPNL